MHTLLVAEDPNDVAIFSMALQQAGLAVTTAKNFDQSMQQWAQRPADMVFLALSQPTLQDQVRRVRAETVAPLILVMNTPNEQLTCDLLKLGADLVLVPPISIKMLIAQIGVLLRRAGSVPIFSLPTLNVKGLSLNPENRMVEVAGKPATRLTQLEFRLLYTLMTNRGQVIPTDTIVERVWGFSGQGDRDLTRGLVSRLRAKIEDNPNKPQYILTISGVGYSFSDEG